MYIHIHMHIYIHICIYIYIYTCTYTYTHIHIHIHIHIPIPIPIHIHIHVHVRRRAYARAYMCIHVHGDITSHDMTFHYMITYYHIALHVSTCNVAWLRADSAQGQPACDRRLPPGSPGDKANVRQQATVKVGWEQRATLKRSGAGRLPTRLPQRKRTRRIARRRRVKVER